MTVLHKVEVDFSNFSSTLSYEEEGISVVNFSFISTEINISPRNAISITKEEAIAALKALIDWDIFLKREFSLYASQLSFVPFQSLIEKKEIGPPGNSRINGKFKIENDFLTNVTFTKNTGIAEFEERPELTLSYYGMWKVWIDFYKNIQQQIIYS